MRRHRHDWPEHLADGEHLESSRLTWGKTMTDLNDRDYYAARAAKALALCEAAADPEIAAIHRSMAHSYFELAGLAPAQWPALHIVGDQASPSLETTTQRTSAASG